MWLRGGGGEAATPALTSVAVARVVDGRLRHGAAGEQLGELELALRVRRVVVAHDVQGNQGLRREPAGEKRRN